MRKIKDNPKEFGKEVYKINYNDFKKNPALFANVETIKDCNKVFRRKSDRNECKKSSNEEFNKIKK